MVCEKLGGSLMVLQGWRQEGMPRVEVWEHKGSAHLHFDGEGWDVTFICTWDQLDRLQHILSSYIQERQRRAYPETVAGETESVPVQEQLYVDIGGEG